MATSNLPGDPFEVGGIEGFAKKLRRGEISAEAATAAYLARIEALEPALGAFEHVAWEKALATARAMDRLLAAGTDLGPLMGVPVAIKDLLAVDGMPTTAGSNVEVGDLIGPEGAFVKMLKRAGCVILGKTMTVEFALGSAGTNPIRGTPRNPWDAGVFRAPGGSSSGSAVAMAAGMCGFAIGSDTGGSVRGPAAFCGVLGLKTTKGLWPTDGVFPLSRTLDTIGLLTRSAADCALVFATLTGQPRPQAAPARGLRLGKPKSYFFDDLAPNVEACSRAMMTALDKAGVEIVEVDLPEAANLSTMFMPLAPTELVAAMGSERFLAARDKMDPEIVARVTMGLGVMADDYIRLLDRQRALSRRVVERLRGVDGIVSPTRSLVAPTISECLDPKAGPRLTSGMGRNTRPGNVFGLCATTTPIQALVPSTLPVGFQIMCAEGRDAHVLSIALLLEEIVGPPPRPDVTAFLKAST